MNPVCPVRRKPARPAPCLRPGAGGGGTAALYRACGWYSVRAMPIFRADSAFDEARKDGGTLSGLPVRGIADEATGLFALASGPASSSNDALERLQRASTEAFGLEARQLAELVRAELLRLPPSVEATALFVNAAGVALLCQRR